LIHGSRYIYGIVLAGLTAVQVTWARADSPLSTAPVAVPAGRWRDATIEEYRQHLTALTTLVQACAKARDLKNCDPLLVGPDDRIPIGSGAHSERRLIRYGWLRVLFSRAEEPDEASEAPDQGAKKTSAQADTPVPLTTTQLLQAAETRLAIDVAQTNAPRETAAAHALERNAMKQVLAGRDFRNLEQPTVRDSVLEKVGTWLNHLFKSATRLQARSAWIGRVIVLGFIAGVCVLLAWGLLRVERRWRVRLIPEDRGPASGAPSARNWQLWLDDARRAAAAGQWREAIHFVYWAAIARLEARRLWPADRARTPREYLALVGTDDPRKAGLAILTGSFERTWYGGRVAAERDYRHAEEIATALIGGGGAEGGSR
jgi:Domain of unknown function (DUF4129)